MNRRPAPSLSSLRAMLAASALLAGGLFAANPAAAQDAGADSDRVNMLIIYGNDACPPPRDDEITVCARKDEAERYRIPAPFRNAPLSTKDEAWTNRVVAYERVSATGAQSCSAVGAGGWTGCSTQFIRNAAAERKNSSDVQFSKMIDAERQKRLQKIDSQAAKTQAEVEQAETEYEARQRAQAEADAAAKAKASTGSDGVTGGK